MDNQLELESLSLSAKVSLLPLLIFAFPNNNMPPKPLKVPSTPLRSAENDKDKTPVPSNQSNSTKLGTIAAKDISSPHELTAFVKF